MKKQTKTKTFQYTLNQIRPILREIVENIDFEKKIVERETIAGIVEKYHEKKLTIRGTISQIIKSYFLVLNDEIYIHPLLETFMESEKHQNEILHYGLYRYVKPYFDVIDYLYSEFDKSSGTFIKNRKIINSRLINIFDKELTQRSKLNNIDRSLSNLKECNLIDYKEDIRSKINLIIKEYIPEMRIFFFSLLDELKEKNYPGVNQGDILKFNVAKIYFLKNKNLSYILNQLRNHNYISFGHLTSGTVNINKTKIEKWRFLYNF